MKLLGTLSAVAVCSVVLLPAQPALACAPPSGGSCGDSSLTVTLTGSTLSLSVPASVSLSGTLGSASSFSTTMGTVQVQDNRGSLAGWSLTALTGGDLSTGGTTPSTISLGTSNVGGPLTLTTGTITPGTLTSLVGVTAGTGGSLNPTQPVSVASAILGAGGGTYSMTPTIRVTPPANTVAGSYSTTLTFTLTG